MEDHKKLILQYRDWIPNYAIVNEEITEPQFRKYCEQTETLIRHLCHTIWASGTFDVKVYHIFMRHMKGILDTVYMDDDMADLLSGLSM